MAAAPVPCPCVLLSSNQPKPAMPRIAGSLLACALALANTSANAQAGATPAPPEGRDASTAGEPRGGSAQVPTADDICRALEQSAAENALPVEFFARVIWQESRFDAQAVSPKGAAGIAQFMPATASWHGLADPFDPVECGRRVYCGPTLWAAPSSSRTSRTSLPCVANPCPNPDAKRTCKPSAALLFKRFSLQSELADRVGNVECPLAALPTKHSFLPPKSTGRDVGNSGR